MVLLAIDTSASWCSAAVYECNSKQVLASRSDEIGRGHAEILMGQIDACLHECEVGYAGLGCLAVTIGPGSFTGVRVGMAAAKGLGLSLLIPMVGISTLEAAKARAIELGAKEPVAVALDARRNETYFLGPNQPAHTKPMPELENWLVEHKGPVCGSALAHVSDSIRKQLNIIHEEAHTPIDVIARLGSQKQSSHKMPEPLYLRSADAKVQSGFALPRAEA